jgi:hypothetical protein
MPSGCLAPCGCDDVGEVLDLGRIGTCSAHVLEGSPKVVHRAGMILPPKALSRPLQAQSAKIKKLTGGLAHRADVAREWGRGNFSQRV